MNNLISVFLGILLILLYFTESNYSKNLRSYDLVIPWNQIFPERSADFKEIEELSEWLSRKTSRESVILSNIDSIRALSERSVLGSNATPLRRDKLKIWLENKLLYENFLENPTNEYILKAIQKKGIDYIIIKSNVPSGLPVVYSSISYKIVKVI